MVEIIFVLRGKTIDLDTLEDAREKAALRVIEKSLRERVGFVRCPEHGAYPRVTATGPRADSLEFDLAGCCDALLKRTAACFE